MTRQPWMDDAECLNHDPEIWFPSETATAYPREAIEICHTCPVISSCAKYARDNPHHVTYGVWAATYWYRGKPRKPQKNRKAKP